MIWYILKQSDHFDKYIPIRKDQKRPKKYPLSLGEVVKFGRVCYKVIKLNPCVESNIEALNKNQNDKNFLENTQSEAMGEN